MRFRSVLLWTSLLVYLIARLSQLYSDRLPGIAIVLLHVVPPAVFALVHGSILYRVRGMMVFTACCLGVAGLAESLSLRTGFPFGHYYFTDVMGPKIFQLPILLVLAYLGIGYVSWTLSLLILGYRDKPLTGVRVMAQPVLASFLLFAWDLSMDAGWGTYHRAWIWLDGGAFFGVPVSNFFGWYFAAYIFYQAFALYCRTVPPHQPRSYWRAAILLYAICAMGNVLLLKLPNAAPMVMDATGKLWATTDIFGTTVIISLLVMTPMALLAWLRLEESCRCAINTPAFGRRSRQQG